MPAFLLGAAALLCLLLALHPFVFYPLSLRRLSRRQSPPHGVAQARPHTAGPSVAICVCAYNEESCIERKMANLLELRAQFGALDILVYVDGSSDRTAELLAPFADSATLIVSSGRHGKTHGMNLLVAQSTADIVVFTDANVDVDPRAIEALVRAFDDPEVGCVCGHLVYTNGQETATAEIGSLYWRLEEQVKRSESALGAVMGADGSLFAIRRRLHEPVPETLIDDMFVSLSILCAGYRVVRAPDALAYEASVTAPAEEFRRKIRIACQACNVHRVLWPRLRRLPALIVYMYLSHKLLRWLSGFNLLLSAALGAAALALLGVPAAALLAATAAGCVLLAASVRYQLRPWVAIAEILIALLGAAAGVLQSVRGQTFQIWTPAASIRRGE
jgi:cellulose synthase/poly-beta-1,6-N-acetylglucosamine synthase-like glycosyltransferase